MGAFVGEVRGFFNFVNIMWLMAIAGIACSVGPALYVLGEPLWRCRGTGEGRRGGGEEVCAWLAE